MSAGDTAFRHRQYSWNLLAWSLRTASANCFGEDIASRGPDLKTHELLIFSMLAALGGRERRPSGLGRLEAIASYASGAALA